MVDKNLAVQLHRILLFSSSGLRLVYIVAKIALSKRVLKNKYIFEILKTHKQHDS
jgi:hypothetical protein